MHPYSHSRSYKWLVRVFYCVLICQLCAVLISDFWMLRVPWMLTEEWNWESTMWATHPACACCVCVCACVEELDSSRVVGCSTRSNHNHRLNFSHARSSYFVLCASCFLLRASYSTMYNVLRSFEAPQPASQPASYVVSAGSHRGGGPLLVLVIRCVMSWVPGPLSNFRITAAASTRHPGTPTVTHSIDAGRLHGPTFIVYCKKHTGIYKKSICNRSRDDYE